MGSHFEDPVVPGSVESRGSDGRRRPRCVFSGRLLREEPAPTAPGDLSSRLDGVLRMMERFGLRGGEAEDMATALLIPENSPDTIRGISPLDVRSAARDARRAATRRIEAELEALRRRPEVDPASVLPTREERREARRRLVSLLREGARRVDSLDLRNFASGLLDFWRRDPRTVLGSRSRGEGAIRAAFGSLLRPWGAEVTAALGSSAIVRIVLRALRLWARIELPPRVHCRRRV